MPVAASEATTAAEAAKAAVHVPDRSNKGSGARALTQKQKSMATPSLNGGDYGPHWKEQMQAEIRFGEKLAADRLAKQGTGKELAAELGDVPVQIVQEPQHIGKELSKLGDQLGSGRYTVHPVRFQASPGSPEPAAGGPGLLLE